MKKRLIEFLSYLGIGQTKFEEKVGLSRGLINNIKGEISLKTINKIVSAYPEINKEWLISGEGDMLKNIEKADVQFYEPENRLSGRKLIPFYDMATEAGTVRMSNMEDGNEPAEYIDAGDWFLDADSAMRVHGDSMFPEYKSGSIIVMREVYDKRLIVYGEDYMVQTGEYRVIKRLYKGNSEGYWIACSINDETWEKGPMKGRLIYEPFDIFLDDVIKVCRVLGTVRRNESSRIVYNRRNK